MGLRFFETFFFPQSFLFLRLKTMSLLSKYGDTKKEVFTDSNVSSGALVLSNED